MLINHSQIVPSPCIRVCKLDPADLCSGCGRTLDEIARWSRMSDTERRVTLMRAQERQRPDAAAG